MQYEALFRCDASPAIGGGHVMRCLALAEVLGANGWNVTFASRPETFVSLPMLSKSDFNLRHVTSSENDEPSELARLISDPCKLLVVDHYGWDAARESACRDWAQRILVIDDGTGRNHDCDILLDSAARKKHLYSNLVPADATVLTGPRHALIRQAFTTHRATRTPRTEDPVRSVFVSFGATDPFNATKVALDALADALPDARVTVALSSQAPNLEELRRDAGRNVRFALDVIDMASLLAEADLALGAGGGLSFERAILGLPSIVVRVAENQRSLIALLAEAGAALDVGPLDDGTGGRLRDALTRLADDPEARNRMSEAAADLVDGRGPKRLMTVLAGSVPLGDESSVSLSLTEPEERDTILNWQQEPGARRYARNRKAPSADEHRLWFEQTIASTERNLFTIRLDSEPVGNLRLDWLPDTDGRFEVSIIVSQAARGRGVAHAALELARRYLPNAIFDAYIHPRNVPSRKLFRNAGYRHVSDDLYRSFPS